MTEIYAEEDKYIYNEDTEILRDIAAYEIGKFLVKWGRINVRQTKSKYGTVRVYCSLGYWSFHSFFHPTHIWVRWPKWLYTADLFVGQYVMKYLNYLVVPYQKFIYKKAYERAVKRFPTIAKNILICTDFPEILKPLIEKHGLKDE